MMTIFIPASLSTLTHWSASSDDGLKSSGDSLPVPHSMSVNVLIVKWMKAVISSFCHSSWRW
jgi:hypothetical protein